MLWQEIRLIHQKQLSGGGSKNRVTIIGWVNLYIRLCVRTSLGSSNIDSVFCEASKASEERLQRLAQQQTKNLPKSLQSLQRYWNSTGTAVAQVANTNNRAFLIPGTRKPSCSSDKQETLKTLWFKNHLHRKNIEIWLVVLLLLN